MIQLKDKSACCGCTACVSVCPRHCITMREDEEGFLYPVVDKSVCVDCGLCEKVCPVINQKEERQPVKVYAAINLDEEVRCQSSSGGIFSLLAEKVIADGGVVFGARFDEHWNVVHDYCETLDGLVAFRGSKYLQSVMGESYKKASSFLKEGRKVLFSGTPCQISGLYHYLRRDYDNLLTVDVVCHGVPSPLVWRKYLEAIRLRPQGVAGKNTVWSFLSSSPVITGVEFRNKLNGWKKYGFAVRGHADESSACKNSVSPLMAKDPIIFRECFEENLFMEGFLRNIYLRPSCYACPAKSGKSGSDITLADYWGIENHHPEMDDDKGTSLVLLNTDKGLDVFGGLKCRIKETTYEQALGGNLSIIQSEKKPKVRKHYLKMLRKTGAPMDSLRFAISKIQDSPSTWEKICFNVKRFIR